MTDKPLSPKRGNKEYKLQIAVCNYVQYALPEVLFFAVPNGGKRNLIEASMLKKAGVKAGVADMLFFWQGGIGAIELKAGKNKLSDSQVAFSEAWIKRGGKFACCYDLDQVEAAFRAWGLIPKYKQPTLESSARSMLQQAVWDEMMRRD